MHRKESLLHERIVTLPFSTTASFQEVDFLTILYTKCLLFYLTTLLNEGCQV